MSMYLRLRDDQDDALARRAEREGTTPHDLVLRAVDEYLARTAREAVVHGAAREQAAKWHELLERLK